MKLRAQTAITIIACLLLVASVALSTHAPLQPPDDLSTTSVAMVKG